MHACTAAVLVALLAGSGCGPTAAPAPASAAPTASAAQPAVSATSAAATASPRTAHEIESPVAATAPAASPRATGPASWAQRILDRHNQHRSAHCAPPLRWSSELAEVAQAWANRLQANGCAFEHSQNRLYGENLSFFSPVGMLSPEQVASGWYDEVGAYDFKSGRFGFDTGHFTQLVWATTTSLGCGVAHCNGGELWVCNYDPPGNVQGGFRHNVQAKGCR